MDPVHTAFLHTIVSGSQFTDEFGKVPELDFTETPVGMIYMATRRVGDNIWARMVENVLPNLQQVAPVWENGHQEHPFSGPMMSRWIVPHGRHQYHVHRIPTRERDRGRHAGVVGRS